MLVVNRFRENWRLRAQIPEKVGERGQQVETKNPAQTGVLRGLASSQRLVLPMLLAETEGFEPSIQVYARMLP